MTVKELKKELRGVPDDTIVTFCDHDNEPDDITCGSVSYARYDEDQKIMILHG